MVLRRFGNPELLICKAIFYHTCYAMPYYEILREIVLYPTLDVRIIFILESSWLNLIIINIKIYIYIIIDFLRLFLNVFNYYDFLEDFFILDYDLIIGIDFYTLIIIHDEFASVNF